MKYTSDHPVEKEKPQRLLNNAVAFHEAGGRCNADARSIIAPHKESVSLGAPTIACYAFAIELYLKLLQLLTEGTYHGAEHRLDVLYSQLSPDLQAKIDSAYGYTGLLSMGSELRDASRAFVYWRYAHEYEELAASPETLARIGATLHRIVRDIRPDLLNVFET